MSKEKIDIEIVGSRDCCVSQNIPLLLESFNVFAGENNTGKTTLIRKLVNHPEIQGGFEAIYIPANEINPENSLKTSAKTSPFYKSVQLILKPIFDSSIIDDLANKFEESTEKKEFIDEVNKLIKGYGVDKKRFDIKIPYEDFEADLIVKIAKAIIHDEYKTDIDVVDIGQIGMGTQRLLAMALLHYYNQQTKKSGKPVIIIVEEPEVYLHPSYKEKFYTTLQKLSEEENTYVVISTHDSYFIDLCIKQNIYRVSRDSKNNDCTIVTPIDTDNKILPYTSSALANYLVFDVYSKTLYIELYEYLKGLKGLTYDTLDEYIATELSIPKDQQKDLPYVGDITITTRLRHDLAHPDKDKLERFESNYKEQTDNLIKLILKNNAAVTT